MSEQKRIVEVNGMKLEVDMREAVRIDTFKVGTKIQVLEKGNYGNNYTMYPGMIVGIAEFRSKVGILIAYIENCYNGGKLKYATITEDSTNIEIIAAEEEAVMRLFTYDDMIRNMSNEIEDLELKLKKIKSDKQFFEDNFGKTVNI